MRASLSLSINSKKSSTTAKSISPPMAALMPIVSSLFSCALLSNRKSPSSLCSPLRSDFLGQCAVFRGLPEALNDGHYLVPKMTRLQLQEAIEEPLAAAGARIQPGLVQQILNECGEEPIICPYFNTCSIRCSSNVSSVRRTDLA